MRDTLIEILCIFIFAIFFIPIVILERYEGRLFSDGIHIDDDD